MLELPTGEGGEGGYSRCSRDEMRRDEIPPQKLWGMGREMDMVGAGYRIVVSFGRGFDLGFDLHMDIFGRSGGIGRLMRIEK